jgi:hypothetical protein
LALAGSTYRYEPRRLRIEQAAIAAMLTATPGVIAALVAGPPWAIGLAVVTAVAVVLAVRRAFRLAVCASTERVTVQNYWRTHDFQWDEVRAVGVGAIGMANIIAPALHFDLRGRSAVRAQAIPHEEHGQQAVLDALQAVAPGSVEFIR